MDRRSTNLQMLYLFVSSFVILFTGMGLFPVLPLYAVSFGASEGLTGLYYALIYFSLAAGPFFATWLVKRTNRITAFVIGGLLGVPGLFLMGSVSTFWQLSVVTALVWFSGGANLALISILTGLHAGSSKRGRAFGLMAVAAPLGSLVGGLVIGRVIEGYGYRVLFTGMAMFWTLLPLIGAFLVRDASANPVKTSQQAGAPVSSGFGGRYWLLLATMLLAAIGISILRLGAPMVMKSLEYGAAALSSTATVSGLVAIPVTLLLSSLSDRFGRHLSLVMVYSLAVIGAVVLSIGSQLWHFWVASALMLIAFTANGALTSAMATDLLPVDRINVGLSWMNSAKSASGIVGFAGTGYLLSLLGGQNLFLLTALIPLVSIALLELLRHLDSGVQDRWSVLFSRLALRRPAAPAPQVRLDEC
jgi:PPP family 3-phenylpropionic acid transporter